MPKNAMGVLAAAGLLLVAGGCGNDGGGSVDAFCATARGMVDDNPATVFAEIDEHDPTATADLLRQEADRLAAWADEAPGDVGGDVQALADAAEELADALGSPQPSDEVRDEMEARFDDVEAASGRVVAYVREECGVDLAPTTATPP